VTRAGRVVAGCVSRKKTGPVSAASRHSYIFLGQDHAHHLTDGGFVFDNQDFGSHKLDTHAVVIERAAFHTSNMTN
jgi:hypothetical protein